MQVLAVGAILWLTVINPIELPRQNEVVSVSISAVNEVISGEDYVVRTEGGKVLPSQVCDTDFDGKADAIAFLADFGPRESIKIGIEAAGAGRKAIASGVHSEVSVLASRQEAAGGRPVADGQYVSKRELVRDPNHKMHDEWYRFEGPLLESDKVAYRFYWDKRGAVDVFGKTSGMSVWEYHRGNHHTMQAWGRDVLHNGDALGVGGLGIGTAGERISPVGAPYSKVIIGGDGPIVASFRMECRQIAYKGKTYDVLWDVSMSAGERYITNVVKVVGEGELPLLAALTNHSDEEGVSGKYGWAKAGQLDWVGTYGRQVVKDGEPNRAAKSREEMGMGLLWEHRNLANFGISNLEFDAMFKAGAEIKYYSLAAYNGERESAILTDEQFYEYMERTAKLLANPVIVEIDKSK